MQSVNYHPRKMYGYQLVDMCATLHDKGYTTELIAKRVPIWNDKQIQTKGVNFLDIPFGYKLKQVDVVNLLIELDIKTRAIYDQMIENGTFEEGYSVLAPKVSEMLGQSN